MNRRRRSNKRFFIGLLIYALCAAVVMGIYLYRFWNYIDGYEKTRSDAIVESYMASLDREKIVEMAQASLAQLDRNICPENVAGDYIAELFIGNLSSVKNSTQSDENTLAYNIRWKNQTVGSFTVSNVGEDSYGAPIWEVQEGILTVEGLFEYGSITAPENYSVECGGFVLDERYVTASDGEFSQFEGLYDSYELPHLYSYSYGPYIGELTVCLLDENGNEISAGEQTGLDNCTDGEKMDIERFISEFIPRYTDFTGTSRGTVGMHYSSLMEYVAYDTELAERLYNAIDGLYWSNNASFELKDYSIQSCYRIDDTHYFCDVSYDVDTVQPNGDTVSICSYAKIIMRVSSGRLFAEALYNYDGDQGNE